MDQCTYGTPYPSIPHPPCPVGQDTYWHTLLQHTPPPLSCRSGYKEQDDLVVFDGADQSQYGYCHEQRATYCNTHQDWDISEVGQCSSSYHQTYQKYTNHLCMCACAWGGRGGGGILPYLTPIYILSSILLPTHDRRLCVHNHSDWRVW